jgi:hypothetical protein
MAVMGSEKPLRVVAEGILRTIKAGRRKLSRKKSGKTLMSPGELPVHI